MTLFEFDEVRITRYSDNSIICYHSDVLIFYTEICTIIRLFGATYLRDIHGKLTERRDLALVNISNFLQ